jgi:hypothetical protein
MNDTTTVPPIAKDCYLKPNPKTRVTASDAGRMNAAVRQATFEVRVRDTTDRFPGRPRHRKASPSRRRHPNIDVKIIEHIQALAKHAVTPLLCAHEPIGAAALVGPYRYTTQPLGTIQGQQDRQNQRDLNLRAYAAAASNDLFGLDRSQFVVVPAWEDSLDGVKALALSAITHDMGGAPVTVKLDARVVASALTSEQGPATFMRERIARKLASQGLSSRDWFFALESTPDRRLHLHGVVVPRAIGEERRGEIEQWRAALKQAGGNLDPKGRPVKFSDWGPVPMGWGAYCSKHRLATQAHLGQHGADRCSTLFATNALRTKAKGWLAHERAINATAHSRLLEGRVGLGPLPTQPDRE